MNLNRVSLLGFVATDTTEKIFADGSKVCRFRLATNHYWKTSDGQRHSRAHFHNVQIHNSALIEHVAPKIGKGSLLLIEGSLEYFKGKTAGGEEVDVSYVGIRRQGVIRILDRNTTNGANQPGAEDLDTAEGHDAPPPPLEDTDIPF